MEVILTCAYSILFYYIIRKNKFFRLDFFPAWLPAAFFLLKCMAGIALGLIYTLFYTNHNDTDTFKFFTDSKILFDSIYSHPFDFIRMLTGIDGKAPELHQYYLQMDSWLNLNPGFNDNKTIIRLNTIFRFFSLGFYNVHVVFINLISFTGLFCLYKTFVSYAPDKKRELLLVTFLMPSVLFWGSGLLKDGILISGFGLLLYSFTLLLKKGFSTKRFAGFILGLTILAITKVYVIVIIIPGMIAWWLTYKSSGKKVIVAFLAAYGIYIGIAFNLYHINPDYNVAAVVYYKQKNFLEIGTKHKASMISMPQFECSGPSIVASSPKAFSNTMFRPLITDVHGNPMILLSALENLLLIIMLAALLISWGGKGKKTESFIMFCAVFIIILFVLIGLITPVLGAIVRYKIVALPCLLFLIVYYYDREKLIRRLPFLTLNNKRHSS
jgi:hypothetical protein